MQIDYIEFQSSAYAPSRKFFADAFGWTFRDYGPDYCEIGNAGVTGGIENAERAAPPLVILKADDLEAALEKVKSAGGEIVRDIFSFPGGRRFHFREPGGNVLAVWSEVPADAAGPGE